MNASLLAPTRRKLATAAAGFAIFPVLLALRAIPARWDLLDLKDWSERILGLLLGVPIRLFDAATGSAFASRSEAFLVFPTLPQVAAALLADAFVFYLVACAWVARSARGRRRVVRTRSTSSSR